MGGVTKKKEEKRLVDLMRRLMRPAKGVFLAGCALYFINWGTQFFPPLLQQIYTDNIITDRNREWFIPFVLVFGGLLTLELIVWKTLTHLIFRLRTRCNIETNVRYIWHVLRLPMSYYQTVSSSELISRQQRGLAAISKLAATLAPTVGLLGMIVIVIVTMYMYCWQLATVILASIVLSVATTVLTSDYQKKIARTQEDSQRRLQNVTMNTLQNLETIVSVGAEMYSYEVWQGAYVRSLNDRVRANHSIILLNIIPLLTQVLGFALVLIMGCWYILQGQITPGILLAFQGFQAVTLQPMLIITRTMQSVFSSFRALERVDNVLETPCDLPEDLVGDIQDIQGEYKLQGAIELRHVSFGYDRSEEPLLRDFSLQLTPGQSLALVGRSGCGKSTVAKLISGLYRPWEGEVLFDGKCFDEIPRIVFTNSVSVINQDIVLFEGTVADNIRMWDPSIEDFSVVYAAYSAQIHEEISLRPGAYQSEIISGGKNFSGGQRQRIEIATALAKEPTIMIMDEATSALDSETEAKVMAAIKALGITLIIVAHRLSTVQDCDEIIVMDYGKVLQRGSHAELMQDKEGLYHQLINAQ